MYIPLSSEASSTLATAATPSSSAAATHITAASIAAVTHNFFTRATTERLSAGAIVGIAIGAILFLTLLVTLSIFLYRHLVHVRALNAEKRRLAQEAAARQAAIDAEIRRQAVREQVWQNAKIIADDMRRRGEEEKWDRLKARRERERRMREIEERVEREKQAGLWKPAAVAQPVADVEKEHAEREVYRPGVVQSSSHDHSSA